MRFDLTKIKLSNNDIKRGLTLPECPSKELAEFVGIMAGDGHVSFKGDRHFINISGDSRYDLQYLRDYVKPLAKKLFGLNFKVRLHNGENSVSIQFESKGVVGFLRKIGYYKHHSRNIKIPKWIGDNYSLNFIKGLADTDFSLMLYRNRKKYPHYPVLSLTLADKNLILYVSDILNKIGFNVNIILNDKKFDRRFNKTWLQHRIRLSGRKNLTLWMNLIRFRNKRHLDKYEEYLISGKIKRKIGRPSKRI